MNKRETATVLAALRMWQKPHTNAELESIATDDGTIEQLRSDEIDALCERINLGEPSPLQLAAKSSLRGLIVYCSQYYCEDITKRVTVELFDALQADGIDVSEDAEEVAEIRNELEAANELKF